ncbi:MAG: o-succinylbenzoate synthase [Solirubrobacterales bacterium]|jgi:o-succinylbenzoate synthase|nr:o-succinylbenzoate synthase [Solirubrobacterales bacterium]
MKVTEVEVIPIALPFERPYATARGTLEQREMIVARLITDEGLVGLGEAVPLALRGGADLGAVGRGIRKGTRRLRRAELSDFAGDEPTLAAVDAFIHSVAGRRLPAPSKAAIEMAVFDLAGKASNRPLWSLLGATEAGPVACNATLVAGEPGAVAADAERWAALGFTTFKLKLGVGDDVAQVRAVRERLGPEAKIRVDANGAWTVDEALGVLRLLEPLGIELVEQPVGTAAGMAEITAALSIPIAADETVASVKEAERAKRDGACDLATVKLAKVGGIGEANGIAQALPIYLSSALDGPLGIAAAAHAAQVLPERGPATGIAQGLATQLLFSSTVASRECSLAGGLLSVPEGPGLGVELDEAAVAEHRIG